jgi:hypothetical protein
MAQQVAHYEPQNSKEAAEILGFYPGLRVAQEGRSGLIVRHNGGTKASPKVKILFDDDGVGYPSIHSLVKLPDLTERKQLIPLEPIKGGDLVRLPVEETIWTVVSVKKFNGINYLLLTIPDSPDPLHSETDQLEEISPLWFDEHGNSKRVVYQKVGVSPHSSFKPNLFTYETPEQQTLAQQGYLAGNTIRLADGKLALIHNHNLDGFFIVSSVPGRYFTIDDAEIIKYPITQFLWRV